MLKTILAGLVLAGVTFITIVVGAALDLEIESVALLGIAAGAIVALVPDQAPSRRLVAFALGFVFAVVAFLLRAAFLPDTSTGRAVAAGLVLLLCVGVSAISVGRLPLWGALLGAASLVGAYEFTFTQDPPRVVETALSSGTALALCVGIGFLAMSLLAPTTAANDETPARDRDETPIDNMMENSK